MATKNLTPALTDIQSSIGSFGFAIEAVGVSSLRYPLILTDSATGEEQATVGDFEFSTAIPASARGTHMSRFVAELDKIRATPFGLNEGRKLARILSDRLDNAAVKIDVRASWFRRVEAPVSKLASMQELKLQFLIEATAGAAGGMTQLGVELSAKALCPCSKAISESGAHNQRTKLRALLTIDLDHAKNSLPPYGVIASLMEQAASSPIYPLLKRSDEKYVTELAYDQPVFVEDLVRGMAQRFAEQGYVQAFTVEATNLESIHAHDCFARVTWRR